MRGSRLCAIAHRRFSTAGKPGYQPLGDPNWLYNIPIEMEVSLDGKITIAKLNIDENGNTAMKYGVRSIPTLIIFKDGEPAAMKVGAAPKSDLAAWIKAAI